MITKLILLQRSGYIQCTLAPFDSEKQLGSKKLFNFFLN